MTAALCAALLVSCSKPMTAEQRLQMLESQQREIIANLHRQKAECQAKAIEFSGTEGVEKIVGSCLETLRFMVETSRVTLENFDKHIAQAHNQQMKDNPFNQFDGKLDSEK
jgi:ribosome maturation protein Sdo1